MATDLIDGLSKIKAIFQQKTILSLLWDRSQERYTPNEALAKFRGCTPGDCMWVWDDKQLADRKMDKSEAFRIAHEKDLVL